MIKLEIKPETPCVLLQGKKQGKPLKDKSNVFSKCFDSKQVLTQSEITFLQGLLKLTDQAVAESANEMKNLRELLWQSCDKEDADSKQAFKELNKVKDQVRKLKKVRAKISGINYKLKQQSKTV